MFDRPRFALPPFPPRANEYPDPTLDTVIPLSLPYVGRASSGVPNGSRGVANGMEMEGGGSGDKPDTFAVSGGLLLAEVFESDLMRWERGVDNGAGEGIDGARRGVDGGTSELPLSSS